MTWAPNSRPYPTGNTWVKKKTSIWSNRPLSGVFMGHMPLNNAKNALRCLCPACPVYNQCMEGNNELLFCARGKARCPFEKWGCKCDKCPVARDYNLVGLFYCEKGAET